MLLLKYFNLLVIHIFFILKYTLHIGLKTSKIKSNQAVYFLAHC